MSADAPIAKRLEAYGKQFQKRWRRQTTCRTGFVNSELCGHVRGALADAA